ncbi:hypothetical protein [Chryseobacterium sp. MP_3.2]|uniref:hypothetical protein n=1 Tax=Chryseobacterium sp. MP_3.2 TaxID=3071712 RepID=UPI002DF9C197|nr:hypothetical protein [Chryseobacterium sp. MP_3.2]
MKKITLFFFLSFYLNFSAQQNYSWLKLNKHQVMILGDSLKENSGLDFFQDRLYTLNDSGNSSDIFEIERKTGKIKKILKTNFVNIDWEAIASDSSNLYIGDFGNNAGTRKNLAVYKIPIQDSLQVKSATKIPFYYPEQKTFEPKNLNTDFDAEAMIYLNGKIHIFTKEWSSKSTTHYTIKTESTESQAAEKIETIPLDYVVTDAAYFNKKLYLVGYTKKTEVFMTVFDESAPGIFFGKKPRRFYLGSALSVGQIEGIAVDEEGLFISGEQFTSPFGKVKPRFYFVPAHQLK